MTAHLLILWDAPSDLEAFDRHYREVHIPLACRLPKLRRYSIGRDVAAVRGDRPYYCVAELEWDSMGDLNVALASAEGRATAADAVHLERYAPRHCVTYTAEEVMEVG